MGEYAIDQMMRDYKRITGTEADRSDFEQEPHKPRFPRLPCRLCGKYFRSAQAVTDHQRDKHGSPAVGAA